MKRLSPLCLLLTATPLLAVGQTVLIDPARGGAEGGAHIADRIQEKQVTLQMATRLAQLLRARGFTAVLTREGDADMAGDARAAMANTSHPIACVLLHASAAGTGVHVWSTTLKQNAADPAVPVPWDEAQAAFANRSHALSADLVQAFQRAKLQVSAGTTWTRPMDNMQCPAVAIEVSPQKDGTGADDPPYQNKVADVIAATMLPWRDKVGQLTPPPPPPKPVAPPTTVPAKPVTAAAAGQTTVPAKPVTAKPAGADAASPRTTASPAGKPPVPAAPSATKPAPVVRATPVARPAEARPVE